MHIAKMHVTDTNSAKMFHSSAIEAPTWQQYSDLVQNRLVK